MVVMVELKRLAGPDLPNAMADLAVEAAMEGYRIPTRVIREWADGVRFTHQGEALLAAWHGDVLAGIGGLTHDPQVTDVLRMRRFYVRPAYRRQGVARRLAQALLDMAPGRMVTVHAGTVDAPAFWESLGFVADAGLGLHRLPGRLSS